MSSAPRGRPAGGSGQQYTTEGQQNPAGTTSYPQQPTGYPSGQPPAGYRTEDTGRSVGAWAGTILAGVLMIIGGIYGFLAGLAIIINGGFFVYHGNYAYHWTRTGWGWTDLILGAVLFFAGVSVMLGMTWARVVGVVLASFQAIVSFMFLPFYPIWSIVAIAVDLFIIWALVHGTGRRRDSV